LDTYAVTRRRRIIGVIAIDLVMADRVLPLADAFWQKRRLTPAAFCVRRIDLYPRWIRAGGVSPSSQSCSLASALHAASIRLKRLWVGSSVARSARWAQFSAFSIKSCDCFMASSSEEIEGREAFTTQRLVTLCHAYE
jgi:hypothetical protein